MKYTILPPPYLTPLTSMKSISRLVIATIASRLLGLNLLSDRHAVQYISWQARDTHTSPIKEAKATLTAT